MPASPVAAPVSLPVIHLPNPIIRDPDPEAAGTAPPSTTPAGHPLRALAGGVGAAAVGAGLVHLIPDSASAPKGLHGFGFGFPLGFGLLGAAAHQSDDRTTKAALWTSGLALGGAMGMNFGRSYRAAQVAEKFAAADVISPGAARTAGLIAGAAAAAIYMGLGTGGATLLD